MLHRSIVVARQDRQHAFGCVRRASCDTTLAQKGQAPPSVAASGQDGRCFRPMVLRIHVQEGLSVLPRVTQLLMRRQLCVYAFARADGGGGSTPLWEVWRWVWMWVLLNCGACGYGWFGSLSQFLLFTRSHFAFNLFLSFFDIIAITHQATNTDADY